MTQLAQHPPVNEIVCPVTGRRLAAAVPATGAMPAPLFSATQVEALRGHLPRLAVALDWIRSFLGQPHRDLGRGGAVCPFVNGALQLDTVWFAEIDGAQPDREALKSWVGSYRDVFLGLEPTAEDEAINKAIVLVFPGLDPALAPELIAGVQKELKPHFVEKGLMIGEFYAGNVTPGLRNVEFKPLDSPQSMIAVRFMVESDLPFLSRSLDTAELRSSFLRSYLRRLASDTNTRNFNKAVEALVDAEIERRHAVAGGCPFHPKAATNE